MSPFLQWTIGATIKTTFSKIVKDRETQDKMDKWKTARSQNCIYTNKILFDYFFLWVVLPSPGIHLLLFRWPQFCQGLNWIVLPPRSLPWLPVCQVPLLYMYMVPSSSLIIGLVTLHCNHCVSTGLQFLSGHTLTMAILFTNECLGHTWQ